VLDLRKHVTASAASGAKPDSRTTRPQPSPFSSPSPTSRFPRPSTLRTRFTRPHRRHRHHHHRRPHSSGIRPLCLPGALPQSVILGTRPLTSRSAQRCGPHSLRVAVSRIIGAVLTQAWAVRTRRGQRQRLRVRAALCDRRIQSPGGWVSLAAASASSQGGM
jgi:hypothetical protein